MKKNQLMKVFPLCFGSLVIFLLSLRKEALLPFTFSLTVREGYKIKELIFGDRLLCATSVIFMSHELSNLSLMTHAKVNIIIPILIDQID